MDHSMLNIIAAAAERLSSMKSDSSQISSSDNGTISSIHAPAVTMPSANTKNPASSSDDIANPSTSSSTKRAKLVLPELTPDLQEDLESSAGKSGSGSSRVPLSIAKRPEWADYPLQNITGPPHPHDVLCGRGGGSNNHPGNESFRELVNEVKVPYVNCPKREKPLIARRIVEAVRNQSPPGRFLQKDMETGFWNDIGDAKAREKTSQALREGAPIIRDLLHVPSSGCDVAIALKEAKKMGGSSGSNGSEASSPSKEKFSSTMSRKNSLPKTGQEKNCTVQASFNNGEPKNTPHHQPHPHAHHVPAVVSNAQNHFEGNPSSTAGIHQPPPPLPPVRIVSNEDRPSLPPTKRFNTRGNQESSPAQDSLQAPMPNRWNAPHLPTEQERQRFHSEMHYRSHHQTHQAHSVPTPSLPLGLHQPHGAPAHHARGPITSYMHRRASDYGNYPPQPPRYSDSTVPIETVRKLLLGQIDPVQLAMQILSPEDAALVARMKGNMNPMLAPLPPASSSLMNYRQNPAEMRLGSDATQVSDDSTTDSRHLKQHSSSSFSSSNMDHGHIHPSDDASAGSSENNCAMRQAPNPGSLNVVETSPTFAWSGSHGSSVSSCSNHYGGAKPPKKEFMTNSQRAKSVLPKKKRKFTEAI